VLVPLYTERQLFFRLQCPWTKDHVKLYLRWQ
jgi:hypothetical protein